MEESVGLGNIDLSPFIRPMYQSKDTEELLQEAHTNEFAAYELAQRYAHDGDTANALKFYRIAEQLGDKGAYLEIALLLHEKKQYQEASVYFEKAIKEKDDVEAYVYLASYYISKKIGFWKREKTGHDLLLAAAKKGYAKAQYLVALTYLDGTGTVKNTDEYIFWMRCAQRNGYSSAVNHLTERMSDKRYVNAWKSRLEKADIRLNQHDEYLAFERLVKDLQESEI